MSRHQEIYGQVGQGRATSNGAVIKFDKNNKKHMVKPSLISGGRKWLNIWLCP